MKKFFIRLLSILAFILYFALNPSFAADINISSIIFDNSAQIMAINTKDNNDYSLISPKLNILPEEGKAYFDLNNAQLEAGTQDLVVANSDIKEILVKQLDSDIVRFQISYSDGFNPKNIQLRKLNNTFFVSFKPLQIPNFYFQHLYSGDSSTIPKLLEPIVIQSPVLASQSMISQINSAFKLGSSTEDKNYILTKKDLLLPSKYYIDNINVKNGLVYINGTGSITLIKPFSLSNPNRIVYDIPNSTLNPVLRNKEISLSSNETIKLGQFDKNTVRVVFTSGKYIPVISSDSQNITFIKENYKLPSNVQKAAINSINSEITDTKTHSIKLVFSKPVVFGTDGDDKTFNLLLYNVDKFQEANLKTVFAGSEIVAMQNGGAKLSLPCDKSSLINIHFGLDGKSIRIRIKSEKIALPKPDVKPAVVVAEIDTPKKSNTYLNKKVVVIDPGHGGSDCGATRNNIYEKNITLDISKRVEKLLEKKGYMVFMTRYDDDTVSLQDRVEISENVMPDVFVSIHVNSSNSESPNGLETHYYKDNSLTLAKTVHASMLNHINANNRGLFKSQFYVINHTTAPAILVEIGFISNPTERAQIITDSRKQTTAKAIVEGIDDYLK